MLDIEAVAHESAKKILARQNREKALRLAVECYGGEDAPSSGIILHAAEEFEKYLNELNA